MAYKMHERGDTLVEVLMAIVILSLAIVGAVTIMSRGLAAGQMALEHSQVRQQVNSQISMLRILRDQYSQNPASANGLEWAAIVTASNELPVAYDNSCNVTPTKAASAFYLQNSGSQINHLLFDPAIKPSTYALPGQGLWVETVKSHEDPVTPANSIRPAYIDFIIRACWKSSGATATQQTVTAQRLYDPSRP